jgi:hypothetical protein
MFAYVISGSVAINGGEIALLASASRQVAGPIRNSEIGSFGKTGRLLRFHRSQRLSNVPASKTVATDLIDSAKVTSLGRMLIVCIPEILQEMMGAHLAGATNICS